MGVEQSVDCPIEVLGSYDTERTPETLPTGVSPYNQDCQYTPGGVKTRPGLAQRIPNSSPLTYIKTFTDQNGNNHNLYLDENGVLWQEFPFGTYSKISSGIIPGSLCDSVSAFGREFLAFSDGKFGTDVPRWFDGTYFDRVSQCGPGAPPAVNDFLPAAATIASPGAGTPATIVASGGAVTTDPVSVYVPPYPPYFPGGSYTYFTTATFTTTAAHGFSVGQGVTTTGVTNTIFDLTNVVISAVPTSTTFKVPFYYSAYVSSGNGTATPLAASASLKNNIATFNTSAAHGFVPGWTVNISGITNIAIGGGISSVSQYNGTVTVVTNTAHGLPVGAQVIIAGVTDGTYDGTYTVSEVVNATTFQYLQTTTNATSSGGTVSFSFDQILLVSATPTPTSFTCSLLGPTVSTTSGGTATIQGNVAPGLHQVAVMFVTRGGYITKPSPWLTFNASGQKLVQVSNIPVGPLNVVARILIFTPTIGSSQQGQTSGSFYAILPNMQIADNSTTEVVIDFSDANLIAGKDYTAQFNLLELGECAGVTSYVNRLFWWGERAKLNNLVNLTFDGGFDFPSPPTTGPNIAGSGADDGGGYSAWTNPGNVSSASLYASTPPPSPYGGSNYLDAETFGFAVTAGEAVAGVQVTLESYYSTTYGSPVGSISAQLFKNGIPLGTAKSAAISGASATLVFGSSSDNWGASLIGSDVNAASFGVRIIAYLSQSGIHGSIGTVYVRNVNITVTQTDTNAIPLGWAIDQTYGDGITREQSNVVFGDAIRITGDGSTAIRGKISQGAFQDYLGQTIIGVNTAYSARVRVYQNSLTQGTLNIVLFSPSLGLLGTGLQVPYSSAGTTDFLEFIGPLCTAQASIPSDLQLQLYVSGTPTNGGYFIVDDVELFETSQPYNESTVRASFALLPEAYDSITGQLQINPSDGQAVRAGFVIRSTLYLGKSQSSLWSAATDNTNEPALWPVQPVSTSVGISAVHSTGVFEGESGEDWALLLNRTGLYVFQSGEPIKINQEIQTNSSPYVKPTWDQVNAEYLHTSWLTIDVEKRRLFVGVPMFGATKPNVILHMDFKALADATAIADGAPVHTSSFTGRILSLERQRKWSPWSIAANCAAIIEDSDGEARVNFGVTQAENYPSSSPIPSAWSLHVTVDGGSYELSDTDLYDALVVGGVTKNYAIYSPYATAFVPDAQKRLELVQILNTPRILMNYLTLFAEGSGDLQIFTYQPGQSLIESLPRATAPPFSLSSPAIRDMEVWVNSAAYRISLLFTASYPPLDANGNPQNVGNWFEIRKLCPMVKNDPATPFRGQN